MAVGKNLAFCCLYACCSWQSSAASLPCCPRLAGRCYKPSAAAAYKLTLVPVTADGSASQDATKATHCHLQRVSCVSAKKPGTANVLAKPSF